MTQTYVTLALATTPAELGDAATQDDMAAFNALVEERNLEGREVPEEFFLALLDEAAGESGAYEVRVIREGDATEANLGRVLVTASTHAAATHLARGVAGDYFQGVAVVDTVAEVIEWGDHVTDYEGRERRIKLYWDAPVGVTAGWFAELEGKRPEGEWMTLDDSQKVGFPVDLDEFTEDQESEAKAALLEAFPGARFV